MTHVDERGNVALITTLAMLITLVVFMAATNLIVYSYGQGVLRTAVDEAARAGSAQGAPGGPAAACQDKAAQVMANLLPGPFGHRITISCVLSRGSGNGGGVGHLPVVVAGDPDVEPAGGRHREPGHEPDPNIVTRLLRPSRTSKGDERGFAPLTMTLSLGLVVIPVLLLVLTLPTWEERTVDARDAAANAARVLATAATWPAGVTAADQMVAEMTANDGLAPSEVNVAYTGALAPGATVTAVVTVTIPAGMIPGIGAVGTFHYTAQSTQHVDTFRSVTG